MGLTTAALQELWGDPVGGATPGTQALERVVTDSREDLSGALFLPLVGERFDGHAFLEQALLNGGASAALVQRGRLAPEAAADLVQRSGRPLWWVDDTTLAYQQLARWWRRQQGWPVVAITGSAGKTTTRELVRAALAPLGLVEASVGNENNDIGVPRTLLRADSSHAALVVEMGMRGLGEIERLSLGAEPDLAVITNIGTAHIGRLGSREGIAQAKCEITTALKADGLVVIPAGDPLLEEALARVWQGRVQRVALDQDCLAPDTPAPDWIGTLDPTGTELQVTAGVGLNQPLAVELPLAGVHNARNLLLALAVAQDLGALVLPEAGGALRWQVAMAGGRNRRLQLAGLTVLDETYNASPEATLAALDLLASQPGRRFAVLGTMLELGDQSLALHRQVGERAAALGLDGLVVVDNGANGDAMVAGAAGLPRLVQVAQPADALVPLRTWLQPGDGLLLKASRGVALEQLLPLLEDLQLGG